MANANFRVKHGLEVTGSVGIGTTNPTAKLDVDGSINVLGAGSSVSIGGTTLGPVDSGINNMGSIQLNGDGEYEHFAGLNINGRAAFIQKTDPVSNGGNGWHYHGLYNVENQQWSLLHFDGSNVGAAFTSTWIYGGGDKAPVYVRPNYVQLNHIDGTTLNTRLETSGIGVSITGNIDLLTSNMSTGISTITGPATIHIDPTTIGNDTGSVRIKGDLYVDGTNFVVDSETITLADHVVGIASTATTDALTDGAGIQIGSDKTFTYDNTNTSLKSSENLNLDSGKTYKIDGSDVLSGTTLGSGVTGSSLTSVGTLGSLTVSGDASFTGTGSSVTFSGNASLAGLGKSFSVGAGTDKMFFTVEGGSNGGLGFISHEKELFLSVVDGVKITNFAGNVWSAHFVPGAEVNLYHNTSKKFETTTSGVTVTGTLTADKVALGDSERLELGNSADLALNHTGTNGYIDNDKGHLYIRNNVDGDDGSNIYIRPHDNEDGIIIHDDGGVELYYDNSKKLETTGGGVTVTGILTATSIDAAVSYAASAGISTTATNATNITIATTPSDTAVYPVFVATSNTGNQAPFVDSSIRWNANSNILYLSTIDVSGGIELGDNDYIYFGSQNDVKVFYDGPANDLEIELEGAANGIAITDNGTYKHKITKTSVGINTGTPREELDVIGDIGVQASGASNRFSIQHNSAQNSLDFVFI